MSGEENKDKTELRHRFIGARAKGRSIRSIAEEFGVSPQTLCNWQVELDDEISRHKAIELEALYEENYLLKEHRVTLFGEQIQAIRTELKERDLSTVATDRLFELLLKYINEAGQDAMQPQPGNKTGTKMDSAAVSEELSKIFSRYRAGDISEKNARQFTAILMSILKAEEQLEIRRQIDKLTTLLDRSKK